MKKKLYLINFQTLLSGELLGANALLSQSNDHEQHRLKNILRLILKIYAKGHRVSIVCFEDENAFSKRIVDEQLNKLFGVNRRFPVDQDLVFVKEKNLNFIEPIILTFNLANSDQITAEELDRVVYLDIDQDLITAASSKGYTAIAMTAVYQGKVNNYTKAINFTLFKDGESTSQQSFPLTWYKNLNFLLGLTFGGGVFGGSSLAFLNLGSNLHTLLLLGSFGFILGIFATAIVLGFAVICKLYCAYPGATYSLEPVQDTVSSYEPVSRVLGASKTASHSPQRIVQEEAPLVSNVFTLRGSQNNSAILTQEDSIPLEDEHHSTSAPK